MSKRGKITARLRLQFGVVVVFLAIAAKGGKTAVAGVARPDSTQSAASTTASERAAEVRALTGGPTRVVWCQSAKGPDDYCAAKKTTRLLGFCTEDGKDERVILSDVSSYAKPIFVPDGERVVYSNRTNNKMYVVNWDGSGRKELGSGFASDVWRDPRDGVMWLYYRSGNGKQSGPVMRQRLDNSKVREKIWDKTATGHKLVPWFRLSADGAHGGGAFPRRNCGVADLTRGKWEQYGRGCWASLAPDNSYRFFTFLGSHKEIGVYEADKKNYHKVNIAGGPGVDGKHKVYHPRWSNDVRFLTVTGPTQNDKQEILLGRFNRDFTKVEKWARISRNKRADFYGDAWIQSAWLAKLEQKPARAVAQKPPEPPKPEVLSKFAKWPGDQRDLMFLWENNNATNQIVQADGETGRICHALARGRAVFGRFHEMDLAGGAVLAQDVDAALLKACKRSNELTIEVTIAPGNVTHGGLARIVSFSKDSGSRNFTLGQELDTLVLRLRTSRTGPQGDNPQLDLCKVRAGQMYHIVVTYQPGRLTCYVNGKPALQTDRVRGNFSNWEPMHLLFGDEWDGGHDWSGGVEGVAIYARAISAAEAAHKHGLYAARLRGRKPLERLVVLGKLLEITPTPAVKDLQEYSRGMVVHSYEVRKVLAGREQAKKIQVAHWAILDRQMLPEIGQKKIGQVYQLHLENYDGHPQLESERQFNDCEEFDLPLYYDVAGRGVAPVPTVVAQAPPVKSAQPAKMLHLKINCAGPSLAGWESDEKYVVRDRQGNKYKFSGKADVSKVRNPAPVDVYQTVRHRPHRYSFKVPDGDYLVRLHFTDEHDAEGKVRKMDFVIENRRVLKGFNIVAAAGGNGKAVVREITVRVADGNGLQINGEDPKGGDVFTSGIEILSR
jgi:hypothetical protein